MRVVALLIFLIIASLVAYRLGWFNLHTLGVAAQRWRARPNRAGVVMVFVIAYGAATAIGLPGLPFTIVGGLIFGTALGTSLNMGGALIGSAGGYLIAEQVGRSTIRRWLNRFRGLDDFDGSRAFLGVLRLRLIPFVPLSVVNFGAGLARVPWRPYLSATALGLLPATAIYTFFADSLLVSVAGASAHARRDVIIASLLLCGLTLIPTIIRRYRTEAGDRPDIH